MELWGGMIGKNSARYNATREIMMITGKEVIYSRGIMPIQIVIDQWTILCDSKNEMEGMYLLYVVGKACAY